MVAGLHTGLLPCSWLRPGLNGSILAGWLSGWPALCISFMGTPLYSLTALFHTVRPRLVFFALCTVFSDCIAFLPVPTTLSSDHPCSPHTTQIPTYLPTQPPTLLC